MVDMKDLRPAFLRLLPAFRRVVEELPMKRAHIQAEVRVLVKKYGPSCGDLYFQKDIALDQFMRQV